MPSEDDEKPTRYLRLAVENSDRTIAKTRAEAELERPLKKLASNIIRVVRGAGRPEEIVTNCFDVVEAFRNFREVTGHWPDNVGMKLHLPRITADNFDEHDFAIDVMIDGALQVAASRLLGQRTQETRGKHDLLEGFRMLSEEFERERAATRAKWKPQRPKRRSEPEASFDIGSAPKKKTKDQMSTSAPRGKPQPGLPSKKPDRTKPPSYEGLKRYIPTVAEREEFHIETVDDIVAIANGFLIRAGQWPISEGDFPRNKSGFDKIAKMVRAFQTKL